MNSRYILLPEGGIRSAGATAQLLGQAFDAARLKSPLVLEGLPSAPFALLDSVAETGPKLVELDTTTADAINRSPVPLRALPEVIYALPDPNVALTATPAAPAAPPTTFVLRCIDQATGARVPNASVVAFDNFAARTGAGGTTDAAGEVTLTISGNVIDRLYIQSGDTHWGAFRSGLPVANPLIIPTVALTPAYRDSIRQFYPARRFVPGTGVRVGVLDTGCGPHPDLNLVGGRSTVTGTPSGAFADIATHGTHVAGLIGGTGGLGPATLGLAPGIPITPYRVFSYRGGKLGASNYAILKAMILAAADGCDIVNLSLGGGPYDSVVEEAVRDAREQGMLVVVAAGNDYRANVSYPAAYAGATAVSAMGRENGFPAGCYFAADVQRPPHGPDPLDYIAAFSNVGPQIRCTGLGSGVLSTLPGNRFGPMSGTSMAAPMVAGAAASLLSQQPATHRLPRDLARSDAIANLLYAGCLRRFGGGIWEGFGLPDPAQV